ncbi:MAG: tetratricopeptide repeat protein [Chloroflexota bacterium]
MQKKIDFYQWLGLPASASPAEVDERCQGLLRYLKGKDIPQALRPWAEEQAALVEEFYDRFTSQQEAGEEVQAPTVTLTQPRRGWTSRLRGPLGFAILGVLAGLVVLGAVFWGQGRFWGKEAASPTSPTPDAQAMAQVRQEIAQLEAIVARDPRNADALFQLGEIYIGSQQWDKTIQWFTRLLEVQPDNAHAYTDIGIAQMELGRFSEARASLLKAVEVDPTYAPAHYSLGFLFAFGSPPDLAAAREHWQKVVSLVPGSELAEVSQVHLDQMKEESPPR